jgi:hypothetical protein
MLMLLVVFPIGLTFGAVAWALIQGRGRFAALLTSMTACLVTAMGGAMAGQVLAESSSGGPSSLVGAAAGGLFGLLLIVTIWGPKPRVVGRADGSESHDPEGGPLRAGLHHR